jgi:hypothetical protein
MPTLYKSLRYAFPTCVMLSEMTAPPNSHRKPVAQSPRRAIWLLLALPYLGLCFPRIYARATPALLGFPFFYWYQFAWVILTAGLLGIVYLRLRRP